MKLRKGSEIRFNAINDFTGQEMTLKGKVVGYAEDIKKISPIEFGGLQNDEDVYLVKSIVAGEEKGYHVVFSEEVLEKEES